MVENKEKTDKNQSTSGSSFTKDEEKKLQELYNDQKRNSSEGDELYGIRERLSKNEFIKGEMQNYFKDFYIHEIDLRGREATLRDVEYPYEVPKSNEAMRKLSFIQKGFINVSTFATLVTRIQNFKSKKDIFDVEVDYLTDEEIKELHKSFHILREIHSDLLIFECKSKRFRDKKCLRAKIFDPQTDKKLKDEWGWKDYSRPYLHFTLRAVNTPLRKPLSAIADALDIKKEEFKFAQLKDSLPVSHQIISVRRPKREPLEKLLKRSDDETFRIGNCEFRSRALQIGDLFGNKYEIAIRGLDKSSEEVATKCLKDLKDTGFINYYGAKRFHCRRCVPVHEIGRALLCRKWKEAVELILKPTSEDPSGLRQFKERWLIYKGDVSKTFKDGFTSDEFEYKMINKLAKNPQDFLAALEEVPFNFRLGYVFAYQSYVWNLIASQRIKRKGLKLFPGDIVFVGKKEEEELKPEFQDDYGIPLHSRSEPYDKLDRDAAKKPNFKEIIHFVTEEDIAANKYSIYDLILPTPGSVVLFPKNDVGIWYTDYLSKDGLNKTRLGDKYFFENQIVINSYFLHGTYRRVLLKPGEFSWSFKTYRSIEDPIISTSGINKIAIGKDRKRPSVQVSEKMGLKIGFTLPADAYVLVALREIVDLNESGFLSMTTKHREAREKEAKEVEAIEASQQKPKEKLDGKIGTKALPVAPAPAPQKERLDGGKSRSRSSSKGVSSERTIKTSKQNFIEVRLTNPENARNKFKDQHQPQKINQKLHKPTKYAPPAANFGSFEAPGPLQPGPRMIDGVQVFEFQTLPPQYPPSLDSSFNDSLNDSRGNTSHQPPPQKDIWDIPGPQAAREMELRRSVFDGRLQNSRVSGSTNRDDYDPAFILHQEREFAAGRLTNRPPWMTQAPSVPAPDDRYDPERELERRRPSPKRPFPIGEGDRYSPEFAQKLRRLDEEALRSDLERNRRAGDWGEPSSAFDRLGPPPIEKRREIDERERFRERSPVAFERISRFAPNVEPDVDPRLAPRVAPRPQQDFEPFSRNESRFDRREPSSPPPPPRRIVIDDFDPRLQDSDFGRRVERRNFDPEPERRPLDRDMDHRIERRPFRLDQLEPRRPFSPEKRFPEAHPFDHLEPERRHLDPPDRRFAPFIDDRPSSFERQNRDVDFERRSSDRPQQFIDQRAPDSFDRRSDSFNSRPLDRDQQILERLAQLRQLREHQDMQGNARPTPSFDQLKGKPQIEPQIQPQRLRTPSPPRNMFGGNIPGLGSGPVPGVAPPMRPPMNDNFSMPSSGGGGGPGNGNFPGPNPNNFGFNNKNQFNNSMQPFNQMPWMNQFQEQNSFNPPGPNQQIPRLGFIPPPPPAMNVGGPGNGNMRQQMMQPNMRGIGGGGGAGPGPQMTQQQKQQQQQRPMGGPGPIGGGPLNGGGGFDWRSSGMQGNNNNFNNNQGRRF